MAKRNDDRRRSNGEGSIYVHKRDANGKALRWAAYLTLSTGKPRYVYGKTRKEAADKLQELRQAIQTGVLPKGKITIKQWTDEWMERYVDGKKRPKTVESYQQQLRLYILPHIGPVQVSKLTREDVQRMLDALSQAGGMDGKPLSPRSVQYVRAVLRKALNEAIKSRYISHNVAKDVAVPRIERSTRPVLSAEQGQRLLAAVAGDRLEALYHVALLLGLREGEVLGLRWADIDFTRHTLRVAQKLQQLKGALVLQAPKTAHSVRTLHMPNIVETALAQQFERQTAERRTAAQWEDMDLVFTTRYGTPIGPRNLVRHFKAALERAELPDMRFHDLRHSCGTMLMQAGVHPRIIMEILGHSQISVTMNTYAHVSTDAQRPVAATIDALYTPREEPSK